MRPAILAPAVTILALAAIAPARADFNVCNKTQLAARVAIGRFDGSHWTSEGWWTVAPGSCAGLILGPLESRYYYLYATDSAEGTWEGKTRFCVAPEARFKAARGACAAHGLEPRGFFEVDTGKAGFWTQTLSN